MRLRMAALLDSDDARCYPGVSGRVDLDTRRALLLGWALAKKATPSGSGGDDDDACGAPLGGLPEELVQHCMRQLPPLAEPSQEEVNRASDMRSRSASPCSTLVRGF